MNNCLCDEELAYQLGTKLVGQVNTNYITNSDGSGFDHVNECKVSSNGGDDGAGLDDHGFVVGTPTGLSDWGFECCGTYPFRFPYKTNKNSCCFNSEIVPLGIC